MAKDFYDVYEEMNIENGLWALCNNGSREIKIIDGAHGYLKLISNPFPERDDPSLIEVMNSDGRPMAYFSSELNFEYLVNAIRKLLC